MEIIKKKLPKASLFDFHQVRQFPTARAAMFQFASSIEQPISMLAWLCGGESGSAHLLSVPGIDRNTQCSMRAYASGNQFGEAYPIYRIGGNEYPARSAGASNQLENVLR